MEWQPIETAPKDGTPILVSTKLNRRGQSGVLCVEWFDGENGFGDKCREWVVLGADQFSGPYWALGEDEVTHWMPLPAPPSSRDQDSSPE